MVTRRLSTTITKAAPAQTQMRTATVLDIIEPATDENDVVTGWQVLLDFGAGEIKRAGVAASYTPVPGDVVTVMRYLNTLFVVDKVVAGESGFEPGGRVAFAYVQTIGVYASAPVATEVLLSADLVVTAPLRTGGAYEVILSTGYSNATATTWAQFRLRQNTFDSGIEIGDYLRQPATAVNAVHGFRGSQLIRNDTGVDLDVVIVPTLISPGAGVASATCTATARAYIEVLVKGSSKLYPHAAPIAAPSDLT